MAGPEAGRPTLGLRHPMSSGPPMPLPFASGEVYSPTAPPREARDPRVGAAPPGVPSMAPRSPPAPLPSVGMGEPGNRPEGTLLSRCRARLRAGLLASAPLHDKARLLSISGKGAGAWLGVIPSEALGYVLSPREFSILLKWWCGTLLAWILAVKVLLSAVRLPTA